jgi:hypothetical protein
MKVILILMLLCGVCYAEDTLTRCPDGSYVNVSDGGQAVRAPNGEWVATGPSGYVDRAPDGSYSGDSE